jgi:hypothetical protein
MIHSNKTQITPCVRPHHQAQAIFTSMVCAMIWNNQRYLITSTTIFKHVKQDTLTSSMYSFMTMSLQQSMCIKKYYVCQQRKTFCQSISKDYSFYLNIFLLFRCLPDIYCTYGGRNFEAIPGDVTHYKDRDAANIIMPCSPGTQFSVIQCQCIHGVVPVAGKLLHMLYGAMRGFLHMYYFIRMCDIFS